MDTQLLETIKTELIDVLVGYGPRIVGALITLIIGLKVIKFITRGFRSMLERKGVSVSLVPFLSSLVNVTLKVLLAVSIMGMIGIEATSFIALLGAAGLAISMSLSGTLQNFAGGVVLMILKPYKVGDVIEAQGYIGSVSEIQVFHTIIKTWDNKTIIIPNAQLSNNSLVNYTTEPLRKVEWIFGISYSDDIDKAREIIREVIFTDERVLDQETPYINVCELADSSVNFKVRAQVNSADYWTVFFEKTEAVKKAFDTRGITIPFPQRDVHLQGSGA
jgi:small conductance mechanosensitive channel